MWITSKCAGNRTNPRTAGNRSTRTVIRYFSDRSLDQTYEHFLQPSRKFFIHASNLAEQSVNHNPESPREFGGVQFSDE